MEVQSIEAPPILEEGEKPSWWPPVLGGKPIVETKRLIGVICDPDNQEQMICLEKWFADKTLGKWMDGADDDEVQTAEYLKEGFIEDFKPEVQYKDICIFFSEKSTGKPVGYGSIYDWNPEIASAKVSLIIGEKEFHGLGLGSEIGKALVNVGFKYMKALSLTATVVVANVASFKALTGAGLLKCGTLYRSHRCQGRLYDQHMLQALPDCVKDNVDVKVYGKDGNVIN